MLSIRACGNTDRKSTESKGHCTVEIKLFAYDVSVGTYKFTGKERDAETGLDYFGARYYGSNIGRFLSPDEFAGGPVSAFDGRTAIPGAGGPGNGVPQTSRFCSSGITKINLPSAVLTVGR